MIATVQKGTTGQEKITRLLAKVLGLFFIGFILVSVTTYKLDRLAKENQIGQPGYISAEDRVRQLECLTRNIYWEAASEPFEGKVAVAQVTLNRVESGKFSDTVCGVVYQRNIVYQKIICQFSWFCENNYKIRPVHKPMWEESEAVAKKVLLENFRLPSLTQALYYHATYINPRWNREKILVVGNHVFYK